MRQLFFELQYPWNLQVMVVVATAPLVYTIKFAQIKHFFEREAFKCKFYQPLLKFEECPTAGPVHKAAKKSKKVRLCWI